MYKTALIPAAAFKDSSAGDPPGKRSTAQLLKNCASHVELDLYFETSAAAADFLSRKEKLQSSGGCVIHIVATHLPSSLFMSKAGNDPRLKCALTIYP